MQARAKCNTRNPKVCDVDLINNTQTFNTWTFISLKVIILLIGFLLIPFMLKEIKIALNQANHHFYLFFAKSLKFSFRHKVASNHLRGPSNVARRLFLECFVLICRWLSERCCDLKDAQARIEEFS